MTVHDLRVEKDETRIRLDVWLDGRLTDLSRSRIQSLIRAGQITVDGRQIRCHQKIKPDMRVRVEIPPPELTELIPQDIPLDILHEDAQVIVVNKAAGRVVHPSAGHASGTLVNALLHHCKDLAGVGGELRPGIVHRLDKDTSGAIVVAKCETAMESLSAQFKAGEVTKEYLALVQGIPKQQKGTIETLIGRSSHDRKKMSVNPAKGRNAISHYEVVESFENASLLRIRIETGRTHQIRVHLTHIGHSALGDKLYGRKGEWANGRMGESLPPRQMLHAEVLGFRHPGSGEPVSFMAPLAADFKAVLAALTNPPSL